VLEEKEKSCLQILDFQNDVIDLLQKKDICLNCVKIILWSILGAIFEEQLIEDPQCRGTIIQDIEKGKEMMLLNILGPR
jgi:hypothetical protein